MSLLLDDRARKAFDKLAPRLLLLTQNAATQALRLHANEVTLEHLVCAAMRDEDCAAYEVVCHAFADPDTVFDESLALAPGLLVVASASTLPFSEGAVRALYGSYHAARSKDEEEVSTARVIVCAFEAMSESQRALLRAIGFEPKWSSSDAASAQAPDPSSLFSHFDENAKKALSRGNRAAASLRAGEIGPVHLFLGCLQTDEALATTLGLNFSRARLTLSQDHADPIPVPEREVSLDSGLLELLEELPTGADSLGLLAALHSEKAADLGTLLMRHKVTPELLARSQTAFRDTDV